MYLFSKHLHPQNFQFSKSYSAGKLAFDKKKLPVQVTDLGGGVHHLKARDGKLWKKSSADMRVDGRSYQKNCHFEGESSLSMDKKSGLTFRQSGSKTPYLSSVKGQSIGLCGESWVLCFEQQKDMKFYGMGEKSTPYEKSGRTHLFWNTDVLADFPEDSTKETSYDPDYISVPYLIIKRGNEYAGILIDNAWPSFISISEELVVEDIMSTADQDKPSVFLGAEGGELSVYFISGPSLPELTRKLQILTGRIERPPVWALGNNQCKWGYGSVKDLEWMDTNFNKSKIPASGLWLDIDYMDGYRVFTFDKKNFPDPPKNIKKYQEKGYNVVPIIDPGVKKQKGYSVYDDGIKNNVFCKNGSGGDFTGIVWPGYTVFPDFSLPKTRKWWVEHVKKFLLKNNLHTAWLDMNDPSTGSISCMAMRFDEGRAPHEAGHNTYGAYMSRATKEGMLKARPDERPFLLSRSGFTGSQQYAANWMGDNYSNYYHLKTCIPKLLNMSLSGMPFSAPDVGGFCGNCTPELLSDWTKACFLFPFFRNHAAINSGRQEPWTLGRKATTLSRKYIRLRYKLLPYLYNCFLELERNGDPVVRPLSYEFRDSSTQKFSDIEDQFMTGPFIMQAPFVNDTGRLRDVVLPKGRWFAAHSNIWMPGGSEAGVQRDDQKTPLYLREGSIIPMQKGKCETSEINLIDIDLLICVPGKMNGSAVSRYTADDGISYGYKKGRFSEYEIKAANKMNELTVSIKTLSDGFGQVFFTPVTDKKYRRVILNIDGEKKALERPERIENPFSFSLGFYRWGA